jgi:hypothetical protein
MELPDKPARDFKALHEQYVRQIIPQQLDELSRLLGVSVPSLIRLGTGWCGESFTFPMYNEKRIIIGIRRRFQDGRNPGQAGAVKLAQKLVFVCSSVRIILPPKEYKDLRGWYRAGLRHDELLVTIKNTKPLTVELR